MIAFQKINECHPEVGLLMFDIVMKCFILLGVSQPERLAQLSFRGVGLNVPNVNGTRLPAEANKDYLIGWVSYFPCSFPLAY